MYALNSVKIGAKYLKKNSVEMHSKMGNKDGTFSVFRCQGICMICDLTTIEFRYGIHDIHKCY